MKIGIIGSGHVGKTLAAGLSGLGHDVMLGTGTPDNQAALHAELGDKVAVGSFEDASKHGEMIIFCVKGTIAEEIMGKIAPMIAGKTVVDTTNPIANAPPIDGVVQYFTDNSQSLFEKLIACAPEAKLVKAFNSVGNGVMVSPKYTLDGSVVTPTMFICGSDASAKAHVTELLIDLGWEAVDMGSPVAARAIEPLCMLWCIPGMLNNQWNHAFKLLRG